MQVSVVKFSNIDLGNRIDAEYFDPFYLSIAKTLTNLKSKKLAMYCDITGSAFYPAATHLYEIGEVPFIRCVDCINYPIITPNQNDSFERLPKYFVDEQPNIKVLRNNDIVITKVGTPCFASIVNGIEELALSRTVLGLYNIKNINPFFLTIFLRSKYGFHQLQRERELTIQYQLTLERVGNILIYQPQNSELEDLIAIAFIRHQYIANQAVRLYNEAEHLLLSELGLADWQPKHQLSFVKNFSDAQESERIDAEYFQPKYDEIIDAVKSYKGDWGTLGDLVNIKDRNFNPKDDVVYKYIELANIASNGEITGSTEEVGKELPTRARRIVSAGDVIVSSIEGSLSSVALITEEFNKALCSTGFYVINSKFYNSETLFCLTKSLVGQMQLKKGCNGTILTAINKDEFSKIILPKIPEQIQQTIKNKISLVYETRAKSKQLLEIAKRGVEMAIEQDEETAEEWIKMQVNLCVGNKFTRMCA